MRANLRGKLELAAPHLLRGSQTRNDNIIGEARTPFAAVFDVLHNALSLHIPDRCHNYALAVRQRILHVVVAERAVTRFRLPSRPTLPVLFSPDLGAAMTEAQPTPRDTPTSESQQSALKAPKDKNCPFCGQSFTSSSLGRHLDLYIRAKNPKPPDGVHVVDEIRKIRGSITRRQVKGSTKKDLGTPAKKGSLDSDNSPTVQSPTEDDDSLDLSSAKQRQPFKDVSWGGANGHPSRALGAKTPDMRRDVSRHLQKADLDQRHKMTDEIETARATELALREMLRSVKEAKYVTQRARAHPLECTLIILPAPKPRA